MKKNRFILSFLALLLIFCFASCNHIATTSSAEYEPIFLSVLSENTSDKFRDEFKDAEQYGLCVSTSIDVVSNIEQKILKNPLNNQNMEYSYSECLYKNSTSKEIGTHYSVYDIYKTEDTELGILRGTNLICYYFCSQSDADNVVQITDKEAKSIADTFVISMVGNDIFSELENVSVKVDTSGTFAYVVNYTRLTNGHKTDENITVFISKSGIVKGYNAYNLCKYDTLKEMFDNDKIEFAKETLINKINSMGLNSIETNDAIITTDVDGKLYIKINLSYKNEYNVICGETVFVNVN